MLPQFRSICTSVFAEQNFTRKSLLDSGPWPRLPECGSVVKGGMTSPGTVSSIRRSDSSENPVLRTVVRGETSFGSPDINVSLE